MMRLLVLCLVVATLLWPALAQAPDANFRCIDPDATDPSFEPYPESWRVLFDTWNYESLLTSGGVLQALNDDGEGNGWIGQQSTCREQLRVCDYRRPTQPQNNWVFTQYIIYSEAIEVNVDVTYDYTSCATNRANGCTMLQTTMYLYERNGADNSARINPNNYNELQVLSADDRGTFTRSFTFRPSANINGFYLGIQDTGTCGNINRITVYYQVCPRRTDGLVTIPDIPFPPAGSTAPTTRNIACASNSTSVNPLVSCAADGTFGGDPVCLCDPGFESMTTSSMTTCSACQAPLFKPFRSNSDRCIQCPENTVPPFQPAASTCECLFSFSQPANEPNISCSRNPSSPRILINQLPEISNTNVEVCWNSSLDTGGRDDFHYNVYVLLDGSTSFEQRNDEPILPATEDSNTVICYTIRNLDPEAGYTIVVVASSGATNDPPSFSDIAAVRDRFILFQIFTGVEEPSLSEGAVVAITFFITALFTALITALIVIALCHYRNKGRGSSGEFESRTVTKVDVSQTTSSRNGTTTELSVQKVQIENFDYEHSPPPVRPSPKPTPPTRPLAPPKPYAHQYNGK